jgi:hypothetical protein
MLVITDEARDYLLTHGGVIYICEQRYLSLCLGRINFGSTVSRGEPKNPRDYSDAIINSIKVYRPRGFESPYSLTVSLQKFLGWKRLGLEGWKLF